MSNDLTSFVGRRHEIVKVRRLVLASRLLTLTGPGGVGKTRLALRVAESVGRSLRDGIRFVELAEVRDASLVAHTIGTELGLHDRSPQATMDTITKHLAEREMLIILDNCEHLAKDCALFAAALLRACPRVRILATSRQPLHVYGETTFQVPPLTVPSVGLRPHTAGTLVQYESIRLFVDRARAVLPDFTLGDQEAPAMARICRRLDGVPLAIELAAVCLRSLSLSQIEERLSARFSLPAAAPRGAPARQRTLRALIDWSYDLCSETEKQVWACASVFYGSLTLAAVEHVGSTAGVPREDIPDIVRSLVEKSVLLREEHDGVVFFRMLETIREYGYEQLVMTGADVLVRRSHRDWYAGLVDRFAEQWIGPDQERWITELRREHGNLRAALDFCLSQPGEAAVALRMTTRIDDYWGIRGIHSEARHWLELALSASGEPTCERASALRLSALIALLQGDLAACHTLLAESTDLVELQQFTTEGAYLLLVRGLVALIAGDFAGAADHLSDARARTRSQGDARGELFALSMHGLAVAAGGHSSQGRDLLDECLGLASQHGDQHWRSWALSCVSLIEVRRDPKAAEAAGREALRIQRTLGTRFWTAFVIEVLAWASEQRGRNSRAAALFGAAAVVWEEVGASPDFYPPIGAAHRRHAASARSALGEDGYLTAFRRGRRLHLHDAIDFAVGTERLRSRPARPEHEAALALTARERQVAELIADGLTNRAIASRLLIATRTAETHVDHILTKLQFTSRSQIASWFTAQQSLRSPVPNACADDRDEPV